MRSLITQQGVIIVNHTRNKELRTACSTSVSRDANNGEKCKLMQLWADVETGERGRETGGREGVELACTDLHLLFGHNERGEDWRGVRVFLQQETGSVWRLYSYFPIQHREVRQLMSGNHW